MVSIVRKGSNPVLDITGWLSERVKLGELSGEDVELITSWLSNLTLELEKYLSSSGYLGGLTESIFLRSPSSDNSWKDEGTAILSSHNIL